jgi:uncharacterized caspase-like protein
MTSTQSACSFNSLIVTRDFISAIRATQTSLYEIRPQLLVDHDASKAAMLRALKGMRERMAESNGNDLAIMLFSGHGARIDDRLYLLPYEVDALDSIVLQSSAFLVNELRNELLEIAKFGRILLLLDACRSGATTTDGSVFSMDSTALRTQLAAANVTVLTSSSGTEVSYEEPGWGHGAFTKVLLDAFDDPAADLDRNGLISTAGLLNFVTSCVPTLTNGRQHPGMEVRFNSTIFASAR